MKKIQLLLILSLTVINLLSVLSKKVKVSDVLQEALQEAYNLRDDEVQAALTGHGADKAAKRVFAFLGSTPYIKKVGYTARAQLNALKKVQKLTGLKGKALLEVMKGDFGCSVVPNKRRRIKSDTDLPLPQIDECPFPEIDCEENAKYRSADGTCNDLFFPHDGGAHRAFARFLEPEYHDGIEEPRKAKSGNELPSARKVCLGIHEYTSRPSGVHTLMHMTLGQFLDHDLDKTAVAKLLKPDDSLVDFECGESGCETDGLNNTECFPIKIASDDPDFPGKECFMNVRSQEFMKDGCEIGPREQANSVTSWLDASSVYGSSKTEMDELRDQSDTARGKLRVTENSPHKPLLPQTEDAPCRDLDDKVKCFLAGDKRRNEQVALIAMHTVFVRLHNDYEEELYKRHTDWSGEKLFQEARRLVIAVWQNIVYNEYLPIVFGPRIMKKYKLKLEKKGYFKGYEPTLHGDVTNVFAAAAYRFGHSQIPDEICFTNNKFDDNKHLAFSEVLFRPRTVYKSLVAGTTGIDAIIFGMISKPVESTDRFFSKEMSVKMFSETPPHGNGIDLASLNIQRGRDHGIAGYTRWREFCGLSVAKDFSQLKDIPSDVIIKFQDLYEHVDDIDLFAAGMSEYPVKYGIVGPTFACILAHQFRITKAADRFWFETNDPLLKFTPAQLRSIRRVTLSQVFCDTLDDVDKIQKYSLLQPKKVAITTGIYKDPEYWQYLSLVFKADKNNRRSCKNLPDIDFDLW